MCGRSSLTKTEKEIEARFKATFYSEELERYNPLPNYNVAPTHYHPVITNTDITHLQLYRWGLIPYWAKDKKIGVKLINARVETLLDKSAFKKLIGSKRCVVPMDGFYEWKKEGKTKIPYRIVTTDIDIFSVAGLWDTWTEPSTGDIFNTFTVITQEPNELMKSIHDRMPAILIKDIEKLWLDQDITAKDALQLLMPYPSELMKAYQVTQKVNSVKANDASLIEPVSVRESYVQGSLF
ncbi:MAG: SOS response-associated peptidase [Saprospiraceae bacterium]